MISDLEKASTPVVTALEALSNISSLYQCEVIEQEEKTAMVEAAKELIKEKSKVAQNRLFYLFQRILEKTEDRYVKDMLMKYEQM